ncbi:hypothetical protein, partial [Streptomyces cinnamoneus]|uniref:hypothetical protein n=1 Tax=Streptomyces cinnamoneus TaxID=53446 RepID=UPI0037B00D41
PLEQLPQLIRHQPLYDPHTRRLPNEPNETTSKNGRLSPARHAQQSWEPPLAQTSPRTPTGSRGMFGDQVAG